MHVITVWMFPAGPARLGSLSRYDPLLFLLTTGKGIAITTRVDTTRASRSHLVNCSPTLACSMSVVLKVSHTS
jgi:hypothetical protein